MTKQEEQEIVKIADVAYKAFVIVLNSVNPEEQKFILNNRDMFLNIFNRTVLTTHKLLQDKTDK